MNLKEWTSLKRKEQILIIIFEYGRVFEYNIIVKTVNEKLFFSSKIFIIYATERTDTHEQCLMIGKVILSVSLRWVLFSGHLLGPS